MTSAAFEMARFMVEITNHRVKWDNISQKLSEAWKVLC